MKAIASRWAFGVSLMMVGAAVQGAPGPILDVVDLVASADVVAVGTVISIAYAGDALVEAPSGRVPGRLKLGNFLIDQVLKGPAELTAVPFSFVIPDVFVGYRGIAQYSYRILFLKQVRDHYEFVSPFYPSIVATRSARMTPGAEPSVQVFQTVAAVLHSTVSSSDEKREAIRILWGLKSANAVSSLEAALQDSDQTIALNAAAALLAVDDLSAMPIAEAALLSPNPGVPAELLHNLRVGISEGSGDAAAIPALIRLLSSSDSQTRRAASYALRRSASLSAIPPLATSLDDSDVEVQHNAVMGLAAIAGDKEWGPSLPEFVSRKELYIDYLKAWRIRNP